MCMDQAIEKLQVALELDVRKHNALWCLGNAYTSKVGCITLLFLCTVHRYHKNAPSITRIAKNVYSSAGNTIFVELLHY